MRESTAQFSIGITEEIGVSRLKCKRANSRTQTRDVIDATS
jgi:hypothetical protein